MSILTDDMKKKVPISAPVILAAADIVSLFNKSEKIQNMISDAHKNLLEYIATFGSTENLEFFQTMTVTTDEETLEKQIVFSPSALLNTIITNLNIKDVDKDNVPHMLTVDDLEAYIKQISKKPLQQLQAVKTEEELQKKFPSLYIKYKENHEAEENLRFCIENINSFPAVQRAVIKSWAQQMGIGDIKNLKTTPFPTSINKFARNCARAIENLTNHVPEIIIYMNSHPIDFEGLSQTNKEKLDLYLASQFLYAAQSYGNMDPQRFLIYVANYFKEHPEKKQDTKLQITVGSINNERMGIFQQGKVLTPKDIYEQYKTFLVSHPEIQLLTFTEEELEGLTLEEAEELVKNKIETIQANWKFLPAGGLEQIILTAAQEPKGDVTEEEKKRHQERLLDLFIEKKELYESSNPIAMIQGEDTFDGYIGFIYPNGKVILDKFFENVENGRVADGQAIYIMDFSDFVRLSVLPKRELIINPACRRIIHAGDWQSRVQEEINAPQRNQPEPILQELEGERKVYKMTKSTSPKYF